MLDKAKKVTVKDSEKLHGWDDEKIYFRDEEKNKEWCVSDEQELYARLVRLCEAYFKKKRSKKDPRKD